MKKVTFAILGMGNRGTAYAAGQLRFPEEMQVVAMADNRRIRLDAANKYLHLPESALYDGADAILSVPKLADVMIIATQDRQHRDHAIRAMELGYDLLLEKPISITAGDCKAIAQAAQRLGRRVVICHVLRYTPFYRQVKALLDAGTIGRLMNIEAAEHVGYYHIAHSFVRGNWHKEADSSPMILAKCCHDMDLLLWLSGKGCKALTSFGTLSYFRRENCPEGAPERCAQGCPKEDCPFHAPKFYLSRIPGWPSNVLDPEPTEQSILKILETSDYGRCVFQMDNDVVDHQVVNMLLEDDVTVAFHMNGFNSTQTRTIRLAGTEGEIWGDFKDGIVHYQRYGQAPQQVDTNEQKLASGGHGGGDMGLIYDMIRLYRGDDFDTGAITTIQRSVESHYLAFAAEASRLAGGQIVNMETFVTEIQENQ